MSLESLLFNPHGKHCYQCPFDLFFLSTWPAVMVVKSDSKKLFFCIRGKAFFPSIRHAGKGSNVKGMYLHSTAPYLTTVFILLVAMEQEH